jgi:SSS family solute:Na+ symporter
MGGFGPAMQALLSSSATAPLLTRERIPTLFFLSYTFIPISTITFPHISIFCLTAKKMDQFKKTVIFYPICILAIWLPCVFLGVAANRITDLPQITAKQQARKTLATEGARLTPAERDNLRDKMNADDVLLLLLDRYAPLWLAGLLGAGIMAAVMASDSQILALSTMFAEDVFAFYGGVRRFGEAAQVHTGRAFVALVTIAAYVIALKAPQSIFELAIQYAFSGYTALAPLTVGALFWKRSTKWGALASTLWAIGSVLAVAAFQSRVPAPAPGPPTVVWSTSGFDILSRTAGGTAILGLMPVVPMALISTILMVVVSLLTVRPSAKTVSRYFPTA